MKSNTTRTFLSDVIGIQDPRERHEALQVEDILVIKNVAEFDDKAINSLWSSVRNMGGTIPKPAAENKVEGENVPSMIPNPGYIIPYIRKKKTNADTYNSRIYTILGRNISIENMGRTRLRKYEDHRLLFIVGIGPILSKELGFIYWSDRSDCTYIYT